MELFKDKMTDSKIIWVLHMILKIFWDSASLQQKKNNEVKFLKNFKILKLKSVCRDDSLKLCNIEKPSTES